MINNALRRELIKTVLEMNTKGINQGTSGNASVRAENGYLITPSGMAYEDISLEDVVFKEIDGDASSLNGLRKASSEWRFHEDIYKARKDVEAIVHTHGKAVMTIACLNKEVPPIHYMIGLTGGDSIRCAPYRTFATQDLSDVAIEALKGRKACLLANHGQIAVGASLKQALAMAEEVETLCEVYWRTLMAGGASELSADQMDEALAKFNKGYGVARQFDT
ncbi:MAG: class II aldolase/adducin family protein [Sneathiellales bacterium]|nr:class II aldolase/adducin family protein [Sneathiellales bacterium]